MLKRTVRSLQHPPDWPLLGGLIFLLGTGLLFVYDSSIAFSDAIYGNPYHFLVNQLIWVAFGTLGGIFFYFLDYRHLKKWTFPLFCLAVVLLVLVLLPTPFSGEARGSRSWFTFPLSVSFLEEINLQPAEFSKLALILYLAAVLPSRTNFIKGPRGSSPSFWYFLIPTGLLAGLVAAEPDLGTALILVLIGLASFFFAGAGLGKVLLGFLLFAVSGAAFAWQSPRFKERVRVFLNPEDDPLGVAYQIRQVLIALGSGGLTGLGVAESRQKYGYIPDVQTDAIFAIVGEEFGFLGAAALVGLFAFLIYRGFKIARGAPDQFGRILAAGITSWAAIQTLLNLGTMTGLIPLTGVPLPLISYGGSSALVLLAGFGILLNVSRYTRVAAGRK